MGETKGDHALNVSFDDPRVADAWVRGRASEVRQYAKRTTAKIDEWTFAGNRRVLVASVVSGTTSDLAPASFWGTTRHLPSLAGNACSRPCQGLPSAVNVQRPMPGRSRALCSF